jgi:molybdopterin/thiamine biosynthesis adenylyltransferase
MTDNGLTKTELERYKRQLLHSGFNIEHQAKLKNASALVAGVGGLGGAAATYLAAAGIGKLRLAHYGNLTLSNMNRQMLMNHHQIGLDRVTQARDRIIELNPDVEVEVFNERTTGDTIDRLLDGVSIALSARPNFSERRVLNRACVAKGIPMVEAAMNGMEGYIFNVISGVTPCLNCLFPVDDSEWQELGFPVFGAVSGMLGCIMAMEGIKLITGFGQPLLSHMLSFNLKDMDFRKLRTAKDPDCTICAGHSGRGKSFCGDPDISATVVSNSKYYLSGSMTSFSSTMLSIIRALGRAAKNVATRSGDRRDFEWYEFN